MPLVIKGVQTAEDARLCAEYGCEALVVSNHGGHALQGTEGTIEMLPKIADAVGDRLEVYFDGGLRKGADVLKALALGARAVFVGLPIFWGLSVNGEEGVRHCLEILRTELSVTIGLCGVTDVKRVDRSVAQDPASGSAGGVVGEHGDDLVGRQDDAQTAGLPDASKIGLHSRRRQPGYARG
ncbi:MAG: alpha-hydroxy acid oxidase [Chloroflexi bacterium]|nr:alpha-hydroxy acid oxidase [Chloroflexota bacterium]